MNGGLIRVMGKVKGQVMVQRTSCCRVMSKVGKVEWRRIGYLDVDSLTTDLNRVGLDF